MPTFSLEPGVGLLKDSNGDLKVSIDPKDENLSLSADGLYCNPFIRIDGDQYLDEWTIVSNERKQKASGEAIIEGQALEVRGNARILSKGYCLSLFKVTRELITDGASSFWALTTKDPNLITDANVTAYQAELKDANDIKREMNFNRFYAATTNDGSPFVPRPGALLFSTDIACGTTAGTTSIYESGHRYSSHRGYRISDDGSGKLQHVNVPQVVYAMHMLTEIKYGSSAQALGNSGFTACTSDSPMDDSTSRSNGRPGFGNKSGWYTIKYMKWQCIWSNQEAFCGLLNCQGWKAGDIIESSETYSPVYGRFNARDVSQII